MLPRETEKHRGIVHQTHGLPLNAIAVRFEKLVPKHADAVLFAPVPCVFQIE
jgi:hypothetical protein